jgi:hypothetical protein
MTEKKNKGGRPTKYTPELIEKAYEYLDVYNTVCGDVIPSVVGLCLYLDIRTSTAYDWAKQDEKKEFSDILAKCIQLQENKLVNGGLSNSMNSNIVKLVLGKHGYSDKQQVDHQSSDGSMSPTKIEIVAPDDDSQG